MTDKMRPVGRRTALKTIAVGAVGGIAWTGAGSARPDHYGNGNAIGAFLNERAMFKESPIWDSGVKNRRNEDEVTVTFNALTAVTIPGVGPEGPWGVEPRAISVSPGTEVTWQWLEHDDEFHDDIPHDLVSFFDPPEHGDAFHFGGQSGDTFSYTFEEPGTYLYFCEPHGTPYEIFHPVVGDTVENMFGQRGAVKVGGK